MADLATIQARLDGLLDPYRDRLEASTIYGIPSLKWPGAQGHDFFAAVKPAKRFVSLYLKPIYADPQLLDGISPALRKTLHGRTAFNIETVDEQLFAELESLIARSFAAYAEAHRGPA
jgi:hypothetical protein